MNIRLGKNKATPEKKALIPRFRDYALPIEKEVALPTPPPIVKYWPAVKRPWGMLGNDILGNCTLAALAHLIMTWSANAGGMQGRPTLEEVVAAYHLLSPNDTGLDMPTTLSYMMTTGLGGHKIVASAALELGDRDQMRVATFLGGGLYIGLELPSAIVNAPDPLTIPWRISPGGSPVGVWAPNPQYGHAIASVGYDDPLSYLEPVTWGARIGMGWSGYCSWVDEVYFVVSQDWIEANGDSPPGFNLKQLIADCKTIPNLAFLEPSAIPNWSFDPERRSPIA